jgi:ATP-dependent Lon protease
MGIFRDDDDAERTERTGRGGGSPPEEGRSLPMLPLRDIVVFPHMVVPLFVGRHKSIEALEAAMAGDHEL